MIDISRAGAAVALAFCAASLVACASLEQEPAAGPDADPTTCAQAEQSTQELTTELAKSVVGVELRTCLDGEETTTVVESEWVDLVAVDGVTLPTKVQLEEVGFPADCEEIDGRRMYLLIDDEWYRARYAECSQLG
jgi:hypothetical protein